MPIFPQILIPQLNPRILLGPLHWLPDLTISLMGKLELKPEQYLTPRNPSNSSCSNCRMVDYFKNVDPKMLSELKQVYKVDFEMFGYDFNV